MSGHAALAPSARYRWGNCPGSLHEIAKVPPPTTSAAAQEGTDAHDVAAGFLRRFRDDPNRTQRVLTEAEPREMFDYLMFVAQFCESGHEPLLVEHPLRALTKYRSDIWGTGDAVVQPAESIDLAPQPWSNGADRIHYPKGTRHVIDLKWGQGIQVEAWDHDAGTPNLQLDTYGLAAMLEEIPGVAQPGYIAMHIFQPRGFSELGAARSSPPIPVVDMVTEHLPALLTQAGAVDATAPGEGLNPGPWCRKTFCPAQGTCPAYREKVTGYSGSPFTSVAVGTVEQDFLAWAKGEETTSYTQDEVADLLDKADLVLAWAKGVVSWAKAVKEFALNEASAGRPPTGYGIEQGMGIRKWDKESPLASIVRATGLKKAQCMDAKLKSPTQLEKAVNDDEKWAKITKKFVVRELTKPKLVKTKGGPAPSPVFESVAPTDLDAQGTLLS